MCRIGNCPSSTTYNTAVNCAQYGLTHQAICDHHYTALRGHLQAAYASLSPQYLDDFVMLKVLMLDKPTVEQQLVFLNDSMPVIDPIPMGINNKGPRLRVVLGEFEQRCYFPDYLILPMGYIASDFDNLGRSGFLPMKDYGAGIGHGKYTHRVQWHAVMRLITNQFRTHINAPWNKSPLDLYIKSMTTPGNIAKGAGLNHHSTNLFGYIFDQSADGGGSYSWPDELFTEMRNTGKYPVLGRSAKKSFDKRMDELGTYQVAHQAHTTQTANYNRAVTALQQSRNERNRHHFGVMRWIANRKVGKAKASLAATPAPGAAPLAPADAYRAKQITKGLQPMGSIPNADPYHQHTVPLADIDYGDAILVPHGAAPPSGATIQSNITQSGSQLNPAIHLPNLPGRGHP